MLENNSQQQENISKILTGEEYRKESARLAKEQLDVEGLLDIPGLREDEIGILNIKLKRLEEERKELNNKYKELQELKHNEVVDPVMDGDRDKFIRG